MVCILRRVKVDGRIGKREIFENFETFLEYDFLIRVHNQYNDTDGQTMLVERDRPNRSVHVLFTICNIIVRAHYVLSRCTYNIIILYHNTFGRLYGVCLKSRRRVL